TTIPARTSVRLGRHRTPSGVFVGRHRRSCITSLDAAYLAAAKHKPFHLVGRDCSCPCSRDGSPVTSSLNRAVDGTATSRRNVRARASRFLRTGYYPLSTSSAATRESILARLKALFPLTRAALLVRTATWKRSIRRSRSSVL